MDLPYRVRPHLEGIFQVERHSFFELHCLALGKDTHDEIDYRKYSRGVIYLDLDDTFTVDGLLDMSAL